MRSQALMLLALISSPNTALCTQASDAHNPVPTLDELLGLADAEETPDTTAIDHALSPQEAGEAFTQAVELMKASADRIGNSQDTGLITQRMQEDIIGKLDKIIDAAQQSQSSGGGGSSSSSSNQQQPNQQNQQSGTPSEGPGSPSDGSSTPPGSDQVGSNELTGAHARWGQLPDRLRDALNQGLEEPYSQQYRTLTERYYKALAEDQE